MIRRIVFYLLLLLFIVPMANGMDLFKGEKKDQSKIKIKHLEDVQKMRDFQAAQHRGKHHVLAEGYNQDTNVPNKKPSGTEKK